MTYISNYLPIISIISLLTGLLALVFSIIALLGIKKLNKRSKAFFEGKNGQDLESILLTQSENIKTLDKEIQELFEISNKIHNLSLQGLHKIGILRFNPFKDIGGNQSFAIALLDGKNSGMVISSLHTREGTRIYAKPIVKGQCGEYQLTEEESKVISIAMLQKGTKV